MSGDTVSSTVEAQVGSSPRVVPVPLDCRVLVEPVEEEKIGSLYIPDSGKDTADRGVIVATGPGKRLPDGSVRPMLAQVGQRVLIGKYAGVEVKVSGRVYRLLYEDDILALLP